MQNRYKSPTDEKNYRTKKWSLQKKRFCNRNSSEISGSDNKIL